MPKPTASYRLLDSGAGEKLERVGAYTIIRPCLQAVWPRHLPETEWEGADASFRRATSGSGRWECRRALPDSWHMAWAGSEWLVKPTGFGHLGLFPEQAGNWAWLGETCRSMPGTVEALNLFAYTGGSSLAMAREGARVTHVDAAKPVVAWARDNAQHQEVDCEGCRWIVEDAASFCCREVRRGRSYHGIVLDPPTFGRGPKGQLWKVESDLSPLLELCRDLLVTDGPAFLALSCHTPGFTPQVVANVVESVLGRDADRDSGEMLIPEQDGERWLPAGVYVRWRRGWPRGHSDPRDG